MGFCLQDQENSPPGQNEALLLCGTEHSLVWSLPAMPGSQVQRKRWLPPESEHQGLCFFSAIKDYCASLLSGIAKAVGICGGSVSVDACLKHLTVRSQGS